MYWLLDVAFIVFLVVIIAASYKRALTGMLLAVVAFFARFLYTIIITALVVAVFEITGTVDALTQVYITALGYSSIYPTPIVANVLALLLFVVIGIVLSIVTLYIFTRLVRAKMYSKPNKKFIINRLLGVLLSLVIYLGLTFAITAFIHSIVEVGGLEATDELLRACPVLSLIYKYNPLNQLFASTTIPKLVYNIFTGNFNQLM